MIVANKINISERPDNANNREEFGHFEADTNFLVQAQNLHYWFW